MRRWSVFLSVAVWCGACLDSMSVRCGELTCPEGTTCSATGDACIIRERLDACDGAADGTTCTYSGVDNGVCRGGVCEAIECGNGSVDPQEACDDGNRELGDGCNATCTSDESCGNGFLDAPVGEECDDGNTVSGDECQADCRVARCGDGVVDVSRQEQCDEGPENSDAIDAACRTNCLMQRCGDGIVDTGEVCDDGNPVAVDGCTPDCLSNETCGNGYTDFLLEELCDDGDRQSHDGCGVCVREGPTWTERTAVARTGLRNHAMAYDSTRGAVVLFGGNDGTYVLNETWEWRGSTWEKRTLAQSPPGRYFAAMAFDAGRGKLVLFGGISIGGIAYDDTWEFDGSNWTERMPATVPGARSSHAMAYDAGRGRVVMFGGTDGGPLGDTWEWDGTNWSPRTSAMMPAARQAHAMAYDPGRGVTVLFGGGWSTDYGDTWEWNGTSWTQRTPSAPPAARYSHVLAYDAQLQKVILVGGRSGNGGTAVVRSDTWTWNGTAWTQLTPATAFAGRWWHAAAYDVGRKRLVMFGGYTTGTVDETWEWNGTDWAKIVPAQPPARGFIPLAYDASRGKVVLFGGENSPQLYNDTWEWDGAGWRAATPATLPAIRYRHAMTYDAVRKRVVMFGGDGAAYWLNDTWEWDGVDWVQPKIATNFANASFEAPALGAGNAQYTPSGASWTFTGGAGIQANGSSWGAATAPNGTQTAFLQINGSISQSVTLAAGTYALTFQWARRSLQYQPLALTVDGVEIGTRFAPPGDSFVWYTSAPFTVSSGTHTIALAATDATGDKTTFIDNLAIVPAGPSARKYHALVYDAARRKVLLFGGVALAASALLNDTWEWDGAKWLVRTPATSPPATAEHAMAFDARRGVVVLFLGSNDGFASATWEWDGTNWTQRTPTTSPSYRSGQAMVYDVARERVVLFGRGDAANETWEWDGTNWARQFPTTSPPTRIYHGMAYDALRQNTVLFGGYNPRFGDTWTYRYASTASDETCRGADTDADGLFGCDDPDCGGFCAPYCVASASTCDLGLPRCGDGTCAPSETARLCPVDCGQPLTCGDSVCTVAELTTCPGDCGSCGDGTRQAFEECDDGNRVDGDGCQANCRRP
jgi:cysteine-rich repeat protein